MKFAVHFTLLTNGLFNSCLLYTHTCTRLERQFSVSVFVKWLIQEPFICMSKSKENTAKHVAEYHIAVLKVPWAALSCLLVELL